MSPLQRLQRNLITMSCRVTCCRNRADLLQTVALTVVDSKIVPFRKVICTALLNQKMYPETRTYAHLLRLQRKQLSADMVLIFSFDGDAINATESSRAADLEISEDG